MSSVDDRSILALAINTYAAQSLVLKVRSTAVEATEQLNGDISMPSMKSLARMSEVIALNMIRLAQTAAGTSGVPTLSCGFDITTHLA
jgi:hypothetical protein